MTIATLIHSLKAKKQTAARSMFGEYLTLVRRLASGEEVDSDECSHILGSVDRDENALEKDVGIQSQRNTWAPQLRANQQAVADRIQAERALATAQAALQTAYDRLQPAIAEARAKLVDANHRDLTTMNADASLADRANILDVELLERERAVAVKLREVCDELNPLLQDRQHKGSSLNSAEFRVEQFRRREGGGHELFATLSEYFSAGPNLRASKARAADLQDQVRQLDSAIVPRQQEQQRLQRELDSIHAEKLKP